METFKRALSEASLSNVFSGTLAGSDGFNPVEAGKKKTESIKPGTKMLYVVALGSNIGKRTEMIERACLEMEEADIRILQTSGLWETKAMYVEDQPNFLNGVCLVRIPKPFLHPSIPC